MKDQPYLLCGHAIIITFSFTKLLLLRCRKKNYYRNFFLENGIAGDEI